MHRDSRLSRQSQRSKNRCPAALPNAIHFANVMRIYSFVSDQIQAGANIITMTQET